MSTDLSKTEFLKRYLGNEKKVKRRKKPKPSNSLIPRVKIIDGNIDLKSIPLGEKEINEEEDTPVVAEVIDERPAEVKIKELYESSKWKRLDSTTNDEVHYAVAECDNWKRVPREVRSPVSKNHIRHDSNSDCSPPRKFQSVTSRTRHDSGSDVSPPRERPASSQVKNRRHDSGSDYSPPRKHMQGMKRHESDSDISPPRRPDSHEHKIRNRTKGSAHKGHGSDSDLSPERVKPFTKKIERNSDSDLFPPRVKTASKSHKDSPKKDSKRRPVKTLSGLKAGLQNAVTLRKETQDLRDRERNQINQLDAELSGKSAKTILRDRKTGKRRDLEEENREKLEKEKRLSEQQQKYAAWGKGVEQTESKKNKLTDDLYESSKPLARYQGDDDLEEALKSVIHVDDPMAEFFKKKKKKENVSIMPEYNGPPPPPNRFGIKPGYRWDGVDRSNGFERKYFEKHSNTKAVEEEAYLWSIQDM